MTQASGNPDPGFLLSTWIYHFDFSKEFATSISPNHEPNRVASLSSSNIFEQNSILLTQKHDEITGQGLLGELLPPRLAPPWRRLPSPRGLLLCAGGAVGAATSSRRSAGGGLWDLQSAPSLAKARDESDAWAPDVC